MSVRYTATWYDVTQARQQDLVCGVSVPVCGARSVLPGPRLSLPYWPGRN